MKKKKAKMVTYIDPPMGFLFGFPKPMPETLVDVKNWLIENGYPKKIIDKFGKDFQYRVFIK